MLRLVTQFDDPRARPVVATPSCGGCCCCCCCCLAATITTASYTAMNLGATAKRAGLPEPRVRGVVTLGALTFILVPTTIAVILLFVWFYESGDGVDDPLLLLFAASWPLALYGLYRMAGHERPGRAALGTWIVGAVLFALEIAWGLFTLVHLGAGYLILAALATIGGIVVSRALTRD